MISVRRLSDGFLVIVVFVNRFCVVFFCVQGFCGVVFVNRFCGIVFVFRVFMVLFLYEIVVRSGPLYYF